MEPTQTPSQPIQPLLQWNAYARAVQERGPHWYLIGGLIILSAAAYGILTGSWALAIVAILCGAMYVLLRGHVPEPKTMVITEQGVYLDGVFVGFADLSSFWFVQTPQAVELHVGRKGSGGDLVILTGTMDPLVIRETLGHYLTEDSDKHENLIDAIIRICKL